VDVQREIIKFIIGDGGNHKGSVVSFSGIEKHQIGILVWALCLMYF
jgi:hypothetical protein